MIPIIPIEEKIGKNIIIKYPLGEDGSIVFKWLVQDKTCYESIILDKDTVYNLIDSMQRKGLICRST